MRKSTTRYPALPLFALVWTATCSAAILVFTLRVASLSQLPPSATVRGRVAPAHTINYPIILIPVLGSLVAIVPWPVRIRRVMLWIATCLVMLVMVVGVFSIGIFYLPAAFALFVVAEGKPDALR